MKTKKRTNPEWARMGLNKTTMPFQDEQVIYLKYIPQTLKGLNVNSPDRMQ
ncbi:MAG TPA: hypothetical protein PLY70_17325 [Saprospiraceae bacterium]|nr:hypothetical protein [Saprospiraceae bacterium]